MHSKYAVKFLKNFSKYQKHQCSPQKIRDGNTTLLALLPSSAWNFINIAWYSVNNQLIRGQMVQVFKMYKWCKWRNESYLAYSFVIKKLAVYWGNICKLIDTLLKLKTFSQGLISHCSHKVFSQVCFMACELQIGNTKKTLCISYLELYPILLSCLKRANSRISKYN